MKIEAPNREAELMDGRPHAVGDSVAFWVWPLVLLIATLLSYQPAWNGKLIWDDAAHLTYPHLRSLHGLWRIWTEPGVMQQYYPVTFTVFWIEHKLWGDATLGYHLANILLHFANAMLLFRLLRKLEVPAAGLAAAIFALHPVQVETVAWISELKNTLSTVCYFGSALIYLRFDETRNKRMYAGALALFVCALLSKSVTATLPAGLLVVFWWRRGKLSWRRDVLPLAPFFAIGLAAGLFTSWIEHHLVGAKTGEYNYSLLERCLIAGRVVWFYLGKLAWPANLIFTYPRWDISQFIWWQYLFPGGLLFLMAGLWSLRRRTRGPLAALLFLVVTLLPALGFINVYPFKFSFVADHFQYVACVGPIVVAAAAIQWLLRRSVALERTCGALLLAGLCVLTWRQSRMYTDMETLWLTTLQHNPGAWLAQNDLGVILFDRGEIDPAIARFRSSLGIMPHHAEAHNNLGSALLKKGETNAALMEFHKALADRPTYAEAHLNIGHCLLDRHEVDGAINEFQQAAAIRYDMAECHESLGAALIEKGRIDDALAELQIALREDPNNGAAYYDVGVALHTKGDINNSILALRKAAELRPNNVEGQSDLGNCLLQAGRTDEAIVTLRKALAIDPRFGKAYYNLGNAFLQKGSVSDAIRQFEQLTALDPGAAQPHLSLGQALARAGRIDDAIVELQKALNLAKQAKAGGLVSNIEMQIDRCKAARPYREPR